MRLWWEWFRCVRLLRAACARNRTFLWMTLMLAGLSIRPDQAGVSSVVRALGLRGACYRALLNLCHSSGLDVERLTACWVQVALKLYTPLCIGGYRVLVGDGLKVAKEGRKMPAVKKLHQSSQNNTKPAYIFGHSFQALGWLVQGPLGQILSLPLISRIHEGLVFTNRDRRTLLDKLAILFLGVVKPFPGPLLLLVDAYYASGKILRPLLAAGHQVLTRVRRNAVAYRAAPVPAKRRRGRPRLYGPKVRLRDLWGLHYRDFISAPSPVYGERDVTLRYFSIDLLWRPLGRLVRFVLVRHPVRGKIILMGTDLNLTALEIIAGYGLRFKIELSFRQALYTLGTYAYHFWMSAMTPLPRRSGNQYLHRASKNYRRLVRRKIDAYHRYVQLGCIAQGLLQYLALYFRTEVWRCFRSWLRTMNPAKPPSEAVVAQALRASLPEFLLGSPEDDTLKKFILENLDFDRCPGFQLAA